MPEPRKRISMKRQNQLKKKQKDLLAKDHFLRLRAVGAPEVVVLLAIQGIFCGFKDTRTPVLCLERSALQSQTSAPHSWTCMDLYVFTTPYRITWDYYLAARERTFKIELWEEPAEKRDGVDFIASKSGGSLRDAEMILEQLSLLGKEIAVPLARDMMGVVYDNLMLDLLHLPYAIGYR